MEAFKLACGRRDVDRRAFFGAFGDPTQKAAVIQSADYNCHNY